MERGQVHREQSGIASPEQHRRRILHEELREERFGHGETNAYDAVGDTAMCGYVAPRGSCPKPQLPPLSS
jgi:hypothetical protein